MKKVSLTSLNGLSILSGEEKRKLSGGCRGDCYYDGYSYWYDSGYTCGHRECPDGGWCRNDSCWYMG